MSKVFSLLMVIPSDHNILQSRKSVNRGLANQDSCKLLH